MDMSVRRSDGRVMQFGYGIGEISGCDIVACPDENALKTSLATPNGGVTFDGKKFKALPYVEDPLIAAAKANRESDNQVLKAKAATDPAFAALIRKLGIK